MNFRFALPALFATCLLVSCASPPERAPHPTASVLDLKQPKGWLGMHWKSKKRRPVLIARALDGKPLPDPSLPAGLAMPPGHHTITLSIRRPLLDAVRNKLGLDTSLESRIPSKHDRALTFIALAGHDYAAHMKAKGETFAYWIEDAEDDDIIVADTRK